MNLDEEKKGDLVFFQEKEFKLDLGLNKKLVLMVLFSSLDQAHLQVFCLKFLFMILYMLNIKLILDKLFIYFKILIN